MIGMHVADLMCWRDHEFDKYMDKLAGDS